MVVANGVGKCEFTVRGKDVVRSLDGSNASNKIRLQ